MLADLAPKKTVPTHSAPLLGSVVDGYRLVDVLGTGGMSIVYRGERPGSVSGEPALVAVKVLQSLPLSQPATRARFLARFHREAQVAISLRHPHIVPMLGSGEIEDQPYVIFPLLAGGTLAGRLAQLHEPLRLDEAGRYVEQVADALDYAHAHGVVHRDIKPSNVLLDERGNAYLADFGIARLFEGGVDTLEQPDGIDVMTLTTTGEIIGTPSYMAPEQFQGLQVGPAADVYALGVVLYQLVTGRLPFTGETPIAIGLRHLYDAPLSPRILRSELPIPGAAAILHALAKAPEQRFGSAGDLARAFAGGLQGRWVGQSPRHVDAFYRGATVGVNSAGMHQPETTTATQPVRRMAIPRGVSARSARMARGEWGGAAVVGVLLLLGALTLALRVAYPGSGSSSERAHVATATSTTAATHTAPVATSFRYNGSLVYALDAGGNTIWSTRMDAQVTLLRIANGRAYTTTASGVTYVLQASTGQVLAVQPAATPKKGKHDNGNGGGNGDGNGD